MASIKLSKIPTDDIVHVRFTMFESKHAELIDYLAFFNENHHSDVDQKTLLSHLVSTFIAEDRAFCRWRTERLSKKRLDAVGTLPSAPLKQTVSS